MTTSSPASPPARPDADLAAAQRGDQEAFDRLVAPHRRELLAHCYRMLGSAHDAEDAVQETLLRAWNGLGRFAGRSSLRTWLYRIATNACFNLSARDGRRRQVPVDPTDPAEPVWLEPFPWELDGAATSPAARIEGRESMELAFVVAFQHLPEKERAVLVLRDVLDFSAAETAEVLGTTVVAVNSRLQRARGRIRDRLPERSQWATLRSVGDRRVEALVTAYVDAWERGDADAIVALVTDDAGFSMPPQEADIRGRAAIADFLRQHPLQHRWRFVPVRLSGQVAFACYVLEGDTWAAHSVDVLTLRGDAVARITAFNDARHVTALGLPTTLP